MDRPVIEIRVSEVIDRHEDEDVFFGTDRVRIRYKPPGKKKQWQGRGAGDDYASTRLMLERMANEVLRQAFPDEHVARLSVESKGEERQGNGDLSPPASGKTIREEVHEALKSHRYTYKGMPMPEGLDEIIRADEDIQDAIRDAFFAAEERAKGL